MISKSVFFWLLYVEVIKKTSFESWLFYKIMSFKLSYSNDVLVRSRSWIMIKARILVSSTRLEGLVVAIFDLFSSHLEDVFISGIAWISSLERWILYEQVETRSSGSRNIGSDGGRNS